VYTEEKDFNLINCIIIFPKNGKSINILAFKIFKLEIEKEKEIPSIRRY